MSTTAATEAASGVIGDLLDELAPYTAGEEPGPAPDPEPEDETGFVLDPELPQDLRDLLAESAEPVVYESDEPDDEDEEPDPEGDEYVDPQVARLKAKLAKQEKKLAHVEKLRAQDNKKRWSAEAKKYFPLSQPESIQAGSHRAFIAEARRQHDALKPVFEEALAARTAQVKAARREEWGPAVSGPGAVPTEASTGVDAVKAARERGSLQGVVRAMLDNKLVKL